MWRGERPGVAVDAALFPVNLVVAGRRCVVVGGGEVAARKAGALLDCGADVMVVAPEVVAALAEWATAGRLCVARRPYDDADLEGAWLAVAATDDPAVNRRVSADASARRVWVNVADDPQQCSVTLPSVVRRGPLLVTVSTGGHSPALSAWLRARLERELGPEYAVLIELLSAEREAIRGAGRSTEGADWQRALDSNMLELIKAGEIGKARERLKACLSSS
jgi:siroheme synthase-like protein